MFKHPSPYHFNYGGLPSEITNLSYDELVEFQKLYYSPSNAHFVSYGDLNFFYYLKTLNQNYLKEYKQQDPEQLEKLRSLVSSTS